MYGYGNSMFLATHGILARTASGGGVDPDAQAFITAASITNPTQQAAINQLVVDLKGYNIWTKFSALYPMVGGTNSQHSWNLKNTSQFQISWQGGVTSSANGVQFNGTNSYGITGYNPSVNGSLNSHHFSFYSRTNSNGTEIEAGVTSSSNAINLLEIRTSGITYAAVNSSGTYTTFADTDSRGFYLANRTASNVVNAWRNSIKAATSTTASNTLPNGSHWLGAWNNIPNPSLAYYSTKQCAFASIGDGLTDTEAANFYTAVQAFQVTLGRSIGTQTVSDADAQAFVTNAGIVDQVEANAINNLVIGLKADSLWTKMKAVYPMVGGSSSTMKFNLKNPLDTDAAFRLVFNGGWTFSSNGATPNGTNAFADTKLIENTSLNSNDSHISIYSRTNVSGLQCDIGAANSTTQSNIFPNLSGVFYPRVQASNSGTAVSLNTQGLFMANRVNSTQVQGWRNTTKYTISSNSTGKVTVPFWLGDLNNNGISGVVYSTKQLAFASIGDGLTDTDATNFYNRVQTFNTALARQV